MKGLQQVVKRAVKRTWFLRVSPAGSSRRRGAEMRTASAAETGDALLALLLNKPRLQHPPQQQPPPPRYRVPHSGKHRKVPRHHTTVVTTFLGETTPHPPSPRPVPGRPQRSVSGSITVSPPCLTRLTQLHHRCTNSLYRLSACLFHR